MKDKDKTKEQLISDLTELRQRVAELEAVETERKRAEEALLESEQKYRELIEGLSEALYRMSLPDGNYEYLSSAVKDVFGYSAEEFLDNPLLIRHIIHPEFADYFKEKWTDLIEGKVPPTYEYKIIDPIGKERWIIQSNKGIFDSKGNIIAIEGICRDITERKRAEEALRKSEQNFRHSLDNSPLGTRIINAEGETIYANQAILDIYGYSNIEELKSIPVVERHTPKSYAERQERVSKREAGEPVPDYFEQSIIRKDGEVRHLEVFHREVLWGGEKQFQLIYLDITDRKQAEEALRESEELFRSVAESADFAIITADSHGNILLWNKTAETIFDYSADEAVGLPLTLIMPERFREAYKNGINRAISNGALNAIGKRHDVMGLRKDGSEVPIEISLAAWQMRGEIFFTGIITDITDRKQAEEREKQLQKELNLASRLASVGELAAGVAHEINNPLTGILAFSERLLRKSTDEKASRDLKRIHNEARRVAKVVERFLTFARRREPKKENSDVNHILRGALQLRAYELKTSNIEVETDLTPNLPRIMVDPYQIEEVFLNIIMNAEQAMDEADRGEKLGIKTQGMKSCIRISFTDDGPGIPTEHLDKVFDPFFTTRGKEGGTGLGLSVCHGIVERHDGRIYAKSKPGKGAAFIVELPLTGEKVKEAKRS